MAEERIARLGRLKWRCRRALLELDLVFQRFWARNEEGFDEQDEATLARLLEMEDHDLWALVNGREATDDSELARMIGRLQQV
jgi:antitoxin CptB